MDTWKMIKELMENKDEKFETLDFRGKRLVAYNAEEVKVGKSKASNIIVTKNWDGEVKPLTLNDFMKTRKWERAKQPVDFMTAVEALDEGKTIYVETYADATYVFSPVGQQNGWGVSMKEQYDNPISTELILNGTWYIED